MPVLIRSWNLFHGRTDPPVRRGFLEKAVALAVRDGPDVVCLQEVPVWALHRLAEWSGMTAVGHTTMQPGVGPVRLPRDVTRWLTNLHHRLPRSVVTGQANAMLVAPHLQVAEHRRLVLNDRRFRREHGGRLRDGIIARLEWAFHRRVAQVVRLAFPDGLSAVVSNLHLSHIGEDGRFADAELRRAAAFCEGVAQGGEPIVLAGDLNLTSEQSRTLVELGSEGYSPPGPGIDHILVRGAQAAAPLHVWPDDERRVDGRLLSDHAPVDLRIVL